MDSVSVRISCLLSIILPFKQINTTLKKYILKSKFLLSCSLRFYLAVGKVINKLARQLLFKVCLFILKNHLLERIADGET